MILIFFSSVLSLKRTVRLVLTYLSLTILKFVYIIYFYMLKQGHRVNILVQQEIVPILLLNLLKKNAHGYPTKGQGMVTSS